MGIRPFDQFDLSHRLEIAEQIPQIFMRDSVLRLRRDGNVLARLQTLIHIVASFPIAKDVRIRPSAMPPGAFAFIITKLRHENEPLALESINGRKEASMNVKDIMHRGVQCGETETPVG